MAIDRTRRIASVTCLTVVAVLMLPSAAVYATTSPAKKAAAEKKLAVLDKQVDKNSDAYNQTQSDLKTARKQAAVANAAAKTEQKTYDSYQKIVAQTAAAAYKNHQMGDATSVLSAGNPQQMLERVSDFTVLTSDRSSAIAQLLSSAQRLQIDRDQANNAVKTEKTKLATLIAQKKKLDKQVAKQKSLIAQSGGTVQSGGKSSGATYNGPASGNARTALQYAYAQIGCNYVYGGSGPCSAGFDCSGLVMAAWAAAGVSLPHNAAAQYSTVNHVSRANLKPGDLVFLDGLGHVELYAGGDTMVEAPHTGALVGKSSLSSAISGGRIYGYGRP